MRIGLLIILAVAISACGQLIGKRGNGERVTKTYSLDPYSQIMISGGYDINLVPSESREVILKVDENLVDEINIYVKGAKLIIESERLLDSPGGIMIEVPAYHITELTSSGGSNIDCSDPIESEDLKIELSGAGKIELKLDVEKVNVELSGAALIYLEGVAKRLDVEMSGAGSFEAGEFEVVDCDINISGVGSALVNVSGNLDAQVSGLGRVEYLGDPKSVKGDVSGVGNVESAND
jgi:hypothetical protein